MSAVRGEWIFLDFLSRAKNFRTNTFLGVMEIPGFAIAADVELLRKEAHNYRRGPNRIWSFLKFSIFSLKSIFKIFSIKSRFNIVSFSAIVDRLSGYSRLSQNKEYPWSCQNSIILDLVDIRNISISLIIKIFLLQSKFRTFC